MSENDIQEIVQCDECKGGGTTPIIKGDRVVGEDLCENCHGSGKMALMKDDTYLPVYYDQQESCWMLY